MLEQEGKEGQVLQVTFAIGSSGFGGAGWIGKDEEQGKMGVYFGQPQEYTTSDPHMIDALLKSGVATKLYEEWVDTKEAVGQPTAARITDEAGNIVELEYMKVLDLKVMATKRGIALTSRMKKEDIIAAIRATEEDAE